MCLCLVRIPPWCNIKLNELSEKSRFLGDNKNMCQFHLVCGECTFRIPLFWSVQCDHKFTMTLLPSFFHFHTTPLLTPRTLLADLPNARQFVPVHTSENIDDISNPILHCSSREKNSLKNIEMRPSTLHFQAVSRWQPPKCSVWRENVTHFQREREREREILNSWNVWIQVDTLLSRVQKCFGMKQLILRSILTCDFVVILYLVSFICDFRLCWSLFNCHFHLNGLLIRYLFCTQCQLAICLHSVLLQYIHTCIQFRGVDFERRQKSFDGIHNHVFLDIEAMIFSLFQSSEWINWLSDKKKLKYKHWAILISGRSFPSPCTMWIAVRIRIGRASDLWCHPGWSATCAPSGVFASGVGIHLLWFEWHAGKLSPTRTIAGKFGHLSDAISIALSINQWYDPNWHFPSIPLQPFRLPCDAVLEDFWHFRRDSVSVSNVQSIQAEQAGGNPLTNVSVKENRTINWPWRGQTNRFNWCESSVVKSSVFLPDQKLTLTQASTIPCCVPCFIYEWRLKRLLQFSLNDMCRCNCVRLLAQVWKIDSISN